MHNINQHGLLWNNTLPLFRLKGLHAFHRVQDGAVWNEIVWPFGVKGLHALHRVQVYIEYRMEQYETIYFGLLQWVHRSRKVVAARFVAVKAQKTSWASILQYNLPRMSCKHWCNQCHIANLVELLGLASILFITRTHSRTVMSNLTMSRKAFGSIWILRIWSHVFSPGIKSL